MSVAAHPRRGGDRSWDLVSFPNSGSRGRVRFLSEGGTKELELAAGRTGAAMPPMTLTWQHGRAGRVDMTPKAMAQQADPSAAASRPAGPAGCVFGGWTPRGVQASPMHHKQQLREQ
eukprot:143352-Chlamydomonas_euryale.AAC.5